MRQPAGTGPFALVERETGQSITFAKVEDHWDGIEPGFDELILRLVTEPATQLAVMLTGEADIVALPRELQPDAVEAGFQILTSTQGAAQVALLFGNLSSDPDDESINPDLPWQDVRIREAINRAIDREQLLQAAYDGKAQQLAVFAMDAQHEGYVPELAERFDETYGYDPERAKDLLAEAAIPRTSSIRSYLSGWRRCRAIPSSRWSSIWSRSFWTAPASRRRCARPTWRRSWRRAGGAGSAPCPHR